MPLLRRFIEVQSELRSEAISNFNEAQFPIYKLDKIKKHAIQAPDFTVMTYNVCPISVLLNEGNLSNSERGSVNFKWKRRKDSFLKELKQYKPDILCLQEIQTWKDNGNWADLLLELGYDYEVYASAKPRPTISYQSTGYNRNFYSQAIAWKKEKFRKVAYEPFFFDKAPQTHPTDITPFTGAMAQYAMLEYLYEPPPPQKSTKSKTTNSSLDHKENFEWKDSYDNGMDVPDFSDDEIGVEDGEIPKVKDEGDCVSIPCATYAFKVHKPRNMPRFAIFVVNTKLLDLVGYEYERLRMFYTLLAQLEIFQGTHQRKFCQATNSSPSNFPHLICGDFGFTPDSPVYQCLFQPLKYHSSIQKKINLSYQTSYSHLEKLGFFTQPQVWGRKSKSISSNGKSASPSSEIAVLKKPMAGAFLKIQNKLPVNELIKQIMEICYRFELCSAYHGYQGLQKCHEMEQKILNLRKIIQQKTAQSDWAPLGTASNDWAPIGSSSNDWAPMDGSASMDWGNPSSNSDFGWGAEQPSRGGMPPAPLPFRKEKPQKIQEPVYPNESMDLELARLKQQLEKCALIDKVVEDDPKCGEPLFTRCVESKFDTSDYIFYSSINSRTIEDKKRYSKDKEFRVEITPTLLLSMPNLDEVQKGLPNEIFPSDHLCLAARFTVNFHSP